MAGNHPLAIHGGKPVRTKVFPAHNFIGEEEKKAAQRVLDSGILSQYLGCWDKNFYGGVEVNALEQEWSDYFQVKHSIAINSGTSGLIAAVGACDIGPGDEVIVSPFTMSASASCVLFYGAIPIFADIEPDYFCVDVAAIERCITPRTKAIIVVNIFGSPYDALRINELAKKHNLKIIEDNAQSPYACYRDKFTGSLGDVGIFSLNYHKHIHCGEGGIVTTNDDYIADKVRLILNHGEAVVGSKGYVNLINHVGMNLRMTEIQAAIARCQLQKLKALVEKRVENVLYLSEKMREIPGITPPQVRPDCTHSFYVHACLFDESIVGVHRNQFIKAVAAELPKTELREKESAIFSMGYVKPLYLQPMYQERVAFGGQGYPFSIFGKNVKYEKGICPTAENLHENSLFFHEMMRPPMQMADLDDVYRAFEKVYEHRNQLLEEVVC